MATNRYNIQDPLQVLRQQAIFNQPGQSQNMTQGVLNFQDLIGSGAITDADMERPDLHSGDYGGPSQVSQVSTQPKPKEGPTSSGIENLVELTNRFYTPSSRATDRFNELLDNVPQKNKPGLMRALVAGTTAFGANAKGLDIQNISDRVNYAPYIRDMAEWKEKAGPFQQAAQLENTANVNERTLAGNLATQSVNLDRIRSADEKNEITRQNNEMRNNINMLKAQRWTITTKGDRVVGTSPDNPPRYVDLGPASSLSETERIAAEGAWDVKAASARNESGGNNLFQDPKNGNIWRWDYTKNDWVPANPPGYGGGAPGPNGQPNQEGGPGLTRLGTPNQVPPQKKELTPAQKMQEDQLKLQNYMNENPGHAQYFEKKRDGSVGMVERPDYWPAFMTEAKRKYLEGYDAIHQHLFPGGTGPGSQPPPIPALPTPSTPVPTEWEIGPDGGLVPYEGKGLAPSKVPATPTTPSKPSGGAVRKGYVEVILSDGSSQQMPDTPENRAWAKSKNLQIKGSR